MKAMIFCLIISVGAPVAMAADDAFDTALNCIDSSRADQISECTKAIKSGQKDAQSLAMMYQSRGSAYEDKEQRDRAISDWREALRLDPKNALAAAGLRRIGAAPR